MTTKQCFKCKQTLPLDSFYKHSKMADGRVNKCKECNKKDVRDNRKKNISYYRSYDSERGSRQTKEEIQKYRASNPKKYRAHQLVHYARRIGTLKIEPCEICGSQKVVGHHDDYDKPLNVRWLCQAHHIEWHSKNEALNKD